MQMKLFRKLVLFLFLSLPHFAGALLIMPPEGFRISDMVERASLVFIGEVAELEFVFRENIPPQYTTDVTVKVEEMIKGKPNAGENLVKFMIPGGEGINPKTGKSMRCEAEHVPEFRKGERVLLFLKKSRPERKLPYEGFILLLKFFGKREVINGEISIPYQLKVHQMSKEGKMMEIPVLRPTELPEDVVLQMTKASLKDSVATEALENRIKVFISQIPLGQTLIKPDRAFVDSLRAECQKILTKRDK
jgi:hypothetical protein